MREVSFSPFADGWGHDYRTLLCSSERVTLTAAVRGFIRDARASQVRPVLGTSTAAHLGWFVADELRFSGGLWVVRGEDGAVYDGRSGYRLDALEDLWGEFTPNREQLWSFRESAPSAQGAFGLWSEIMVPFDNTETGRVVAEALAVEVGGLVRERV